MRNQTGKTTVLNQSSPKKTKKDQEIKNPVISIEKGKLNEDCISAETKKGRSFKINPLISMARLARFERATYGLEVCGLPHPQRLIQIDYIRFIIDLTKDNMYDRAIHIDTN